MMNKILVDLDILTVAFWDKNREALNFLERVKKGGFELYTPYALLDTVGKWKNEKLRAEIRNFYDFYSKKIISVTETLEKISELKTDRKVVEELRKKGVKEEDATLVFIASIFEIDSLVTLNRKHLRNRRNEINEVLRNNGLKEVYILLPSEI